MTFNEAIETLIDFDRQFSLCLVDIAPAEDWDRFEEALKALSRGQDPSDPPENPTPKV